MDVYQILIQDHRTIAKMFEEIAGTSNKESERRKQLFSDLWIALEDHEITEENDLYEGFGVKPDIFPGSVTGRFFVPI